jgi:hypothetical protein
MAAGGNRRVEEADTDDVDDLSFSLSFGGSLVCLSDLSFDLSDLPSLSLSPCLGVLPPSF